MIIKGTEKIEGLPTPPLGFLPAIHDATVEAFLGSATAIAFGTSGSGIVLPAVPVGTSVLQNGTGETITLPAFNSWPPQKVAPGEYFGSAGSFWYPLTRYKNTNSFYPKAFERILYTIAFTPEGLTLGSTFTLRRQLDVRLMSNNTDVSWNMVWEIGMRRTESQPSPLGPNIDRYEWREPLIEQQLFITDVVSEHTFGVMMKRSRLNANSSEEAFTADIIRYNRVVGALPAQLPTGPDFVLRIRMSYFDTQNDVADPRGYVAYYCHGGTGEK
jgi:hypothetical protein